MSILARLAIMASMRQAVFRNRRGERVEASPVTATQVKNEFGRVFEAVLQGGAVVITKHDAPKAVMISLDDFDALAAAAESKLDKLSGEFDALLDRMQTRKSRHGLQAAFHASPRDLGKAAVVAARKRG